MWVCGYVVRVGLRRNCRPNHANYVRDTSVMDPRGRLPGKDDVGGDAGFTSIAGGRVARWPQEMDDGQREKMLIFYRCLMVCQKGFAALSRRSIVYQVEKVER